MKPEGDTERRAGEVFWCPEALRDRDRGVT
jgi:hypothetical protein